MSRKFLLYCAGIGAILLISLTLYATGHEVVAEEVSYLGTFNYMILVLMWIMIFDSRKRWPELPFHDRVLKVITFEKF